MSDLEFVVDEVGGEVEEPGVGILDAEQVKKLGAFLDEEFELALAERVEKEQSWKKWRRQREFRPERKSLDYPWPKSANVSVPMAGMLTQNMWAYIKSTFDMREPLISITSITKKPGDVEVAKTLEKYMDLLVESPFDLNLREKIKTITLEASSMGTNFVKVPWTTDEWVFKSRDEEGNPETVFSVLHDGPEWIPVGREDFLYREAVQDLQRSTWIAHHFELSEWELRNRQQSGVYQGVERILKNPRTMPLEGRGEDQERQGVTQQAYSVWDMYEVYVKWPLPGEVYVVDLLVTYHPDSHTIARAEFNEIGVRPVGAANYVPRPFYLDGIGVGWIVEHMQDEVDYHHRLRINNAHFASMMMFAIKRGAGYGGQEKVYPGKIWKVDDPSRDIVPIRGGEIYPSSLQAEAMAMQYAERAVGFSDAQRGFADMVAKSGTSAQLQMFNAQQGGKLINSVIGGMVNTFSELAMYTIFQLVKNKERVLANEREHERLTDTELRDLEKALSIPLSQIPKRLRFYVRTTDMDKTFEVQRQNILSLVQIYSMFWQNVLPLIQAAENKQTPPKTRMALMTAFTGSCNLMEKVFKFFGVDDTQKFVPEYKMQEIMIEIRNTMMGDLGQAQKMLEDVRSGRFGPEQAAALGGAAGAFAGAEAGGGGGAAGAAGQQGMGAPQPGMAPAPNAGGPLA